MEPPVLEDPPDSATTPAEREDRWTQWVRFAIEAATEDEARAIAGGVLAELKLPVAGEPRFQPLGLRDGIWVVTADVSLAHLGSIQPDNARTRGTFLSGHFGERVTWTVRAAERQAKWDWPPDIWTRRPGEDDVLVHPAVRAVIIWVLAQ
jgi:hypothetical protein